MIFPFNPGSVPALFDNEIDKCLRRHGRQVFAVAPAGGEAVRLTDGKEWALAPAWRPEPEKE